MNKFWNYDMDGYIKWVGCICFRINYVKEVSDFDNSFIFFGIEVIFFKWS